LFSDLFYDTVSISDYIASNDGMTEERWNVKDFEVVEVLCLKGLRKTTESLSG
jgi:hypothetical protein